MKHDDKRRLPWPGPGDDTSAGVLFVLLALLLIGVGIVLFLGSGLFFSLGR